MLTKKSIAMSFLVCSALSVLAPQSTSLATEVEGQVEVPVTSVLLPHKGFDDNDRVEIVVTGEFPHPCFKLGDTKVEMKDGVFRVRQFAWLRTTGPCSSGDVPDQPVFFTTEYSLGRLPAADYEIQFQVFDEAHRKKMIGHQRFRVEEASSSDIDDYDYANVSNVDIPGILPLGDHASAEVAILFSRRCEKLKGVKVIRQREVFVVLPVRGVDESVPCDKRPREYRHTIRLGDLDPGQYLIHVRSRNGKAVNKVFYVLPPF